MGQETGNTLDGSAVYNMENTKRWTTIYAHTDTYVQHHNMQTPHREARVSQQV